MDSYNYVYPYYLGGNRHYHGLTHINKMINDVYLYGYPSETFQNYEESKGWCYQGLNKSLYDAILFHDIIYDIPAKSSLSNEARSASEYEAFAEAVGTEDSIIRKTSSLIKATEHHFDGTIYTDYLTNLLLDVDIIGFSESWESFLNDFHGVNKEYFSVYDKDYVLEKRKEFLKNIVDNKLLRYRVIDETGDRWNKAYWNISRLLEDWNRYTREV